ncbi:hypothetical protein CIHG_09065 [Coccidioides immitis H538.4]|uniref:Uncharacterized protein n=3 Tax=Coccidioides immitis TaxID=5501 RepID=A0A0J8R1V4_COCIT|nr:hypothetical protein CIRG_05891 [Coccidioides immitis RMSCC 2394]KMU78320.1 hypothetical protein CISG_06556 [Coccidioides immitis RMSCC 3703]KMU91253.1 hypothetical protein CIHG_09065 [Coccidioides immitis H538.4]
MPARGDELQPCERRRNNALGLHESQPCFFFSRHILKRWRFATTIPVRAIRWVVTECLARCVKYEQFEKKQEAASENMHLFLLAGIQWRVGPASLESTANLGLDWPALRDALARSGLGGLPPVCRPSLASSSRVNRVDLPADQHPPASEEIQAQSIKTIGAGIETNEADEPALNELKASLSHPNSSHHQSTESFESCVAPNEGLIPQ